MNTKLVLFTFNYPWGLGELWKHHEVQYLAKSFEHVTIVPYQGVEGAKRKELPANVTCLDPLFPKEFGKGGMLFRGLFNASPFLFFLKDFFSRKVYKRPSWFKAWLWQTLSTRYLLTKPEIKSLRAQPTERSVYYFYWGTGAASLVPFFKESKARTVVRFHGGDLYEERWGGYLPFRREILTHLDLALFISENGKKYLTDRYRQISFRSQVARLGVVRRGYAKMSEDGVLRLVSCSFMIPLKRIHLIIEALAHVPFPVVWTHLGNGPLFETCKEAASRLPAHVQVQLPGFIRSEDILDFYVDKPVDLFINVSETEGVPVSIMEALSADIPVLATDVGGTSELVDDTVGRLLPASLTGVELAGYITEFAALSQAHKWKLRENARQVFNQRSNAETLYPDLAALLKNL